MAKYTVTVTNTVEYEIEVEAETPEEAEEIIENGAYMEEYVGETVGLELNDEAECDHDAEVVRATAWDNLEVTDIEEE